MFVGTLWRVRCVGGVGGVGGNDLSQQRRVDLRVGEALAVVLELEAAAALL